MEVTTSHRYCFVTRPCRRYATVAKTWICSPICFTHSKTRNHTPSRRRCTSTSISFSRSSQRGSSYCRRASESRCSAASTRTSRCRNRSKIRTVPRPNSVLWAGQNANSITLCSWLWPFTSHPCCLRSNWSGCSAWWCWASTRRASCSCSSPCCSSAASPWRSSSSRASRISRNVRRRKSNDPFWLLPF